VSSTSAATYWHRQRAPTCLLLYPLAAGMLLMAWYLPEPEFARFALGAGGLVVLLAAASFHHLTVADQVDALSIAFGPLPLFRRRVRYENVSHVEVGRTSLVEGWGIHLSPRGGWVWNLWGRDCVVLHLQRGTLRVGTDDAENLAQFLSERLAQLHRPK